MIEAPPQAKTACSIKRAQDGHEGRNQQLERRAVIRKSGKQKGQQQAAEHKQRTAKQRPFPEIEDGE